MDNNNLDIPKQMQSDDANEQNKTKNEGQINNTQNQQKDKKVGLMPIRFKWLIIGIILGVGLSVFSYIKIKENINTGIKIESTRLNIDYLTGTIRNMSDLITSELEYSGIVEYETGVGKWNSFAIEEKFLMVYNAQIKAGIDLSKVKLTSSDDKIIVDIPHSSVKFKKVNPDSIRIYDVKKAFIKGDGKMQLQEAIVEAENDMDRNANLSRLLKSAEEQAEAVIKGLISEMENKEVEFHYMTDLAKNVGTNSIIN